MYMLNMITATMTYSNALDRVNFLNGRNPLQFKNLGFLQYFSSSTFMKLGGGGMKAFIIRGFCAYSFLYIHVYEIEHIYIYMNLLILLKDGAGKKRDCNTMLEKNNNGEEGGEISTDFDITQKIEKEHKRAILLRRNTYCNSMF
jgi:hypothetical protein